MIYAMIKYLTRFDLAKNTARFLKMVLNRNARFHLAAIQTATAQLLREIPSCGNYCAIWKIALHAPVARDSISRHKIRFLQ
jgi:hypothetical protein